MSLFDRTDEQALDHLAFHRNRAERIEQERRTRTIAAQIEALADTARTLLWFQRHEHAEVSDAKEAWEALDDALEPISAIVTALKQAETPPSADAAMVEAVIAERDRMKAAHENQNLSDLNRNGAFQSMCALNRVLALASRQPAGVQEPHVFLDCDGVLADFDTYAEAYFGMPPRQYEKQVGSARFWQELEAKGDFYRNLPLMPDAMALYEGVKHLHPTILTGCPRGDWAQGQKVAWAAEHFPGVPIITCRSADKRDYAKPGDVLIDDWAQHRHRWIEMGGVFIVHHDAESSLAALLAHYPNLPAAPATDEGLTSDAT